MDAFLIAFKFPSFFRKSFAEGGFYSMFVPYFIDFYSKGKYRGSFFFASRIFTLLFWSMLAFSILVFLFAESFVAIMAPGFTEDPEKLNLSVQFTRITFPNVAFVALSTVYSGILVSHEKFFPVAFVPILINIVLISSLMIGSDFLSAGYRISYGVLFAGIFQFVFLYFYTKRFRLPTPHITKFKISNKTKEFLKKLTPVIIGAGVVQVNVFVDSLFCSFLPSGSISFIYFADRFIQLPLALFGISMATVLLPVIATTIAKKDNFSRFQNDVVIFSLRLAIPSVVGLIVLSYELINTLYGHGRFSAENVDSTSKVLQVFAIGLPAYIISKIFASVLFAKKDSNTPIAAAVVSIIFNVALTCILIKPFGVIGIAISTSISGFINAYVMYRKSKEWFSFNKRNLLIISKIIIAACIMGVVMKSILIGYNDDVVTKVAYITLVTVLGIVIYTSLLLLFKDKDTENMCKKFVKILKNSK
jgi:putative peptidoglycan lipid II flippase